ncbi:MAG: sulfotransferase [Desulfobacterales bacterium]|jgi:hypothetical protein
MNKPFYHKITKRLKNYSIKQVESNSYYLSAKSSFRLLFKRKKDHYKFSYPLLVVSGLQRSGTHLFENLLKNHPQILCYYRELQIGKPNKYYWPDLHLETCARKRFSALIPRNMTKHFLDLNAHEDFIFHFPSFKKIFLKLEKENSKFNQRNTLNNFFTAYFNAYLNCNHSNFFDAYKYIVATIPGLSIRKESIGDFFKDYPDGKMFVSFRDPYTWWNSARKHTKKLKEHGLMRYQKTLENTKWACGEYENRFFAVSFDHLIKDNEKSIKSILKHAELDLAETSMYPSNFPHYATDNSTFGHTKTKSVLKEKLNRKLEIPEEDLIYIKSEIYPLYEEILEGYTINARKN